MSNNTHPGSKRTPRRLGHDRYLVDTIRIFRTLELAFEWDELKRHTNLIKHGIDLADATEVFKDSRRVERIDDRHDYGEERRQCIGLLRAHLLFVVYTPRGEIRRLISARKATTYERKIYDAGRDRPGR